MTVSAIRQKGSAASSAAESGIAELVERPPGPVEFSTESDRDVLLEKATPIVILIFALNEVVPLTVPTHVPETRAVANASQRSGPTVEDFRAISQGRTPLFAETIKTKATGTNPAAIMSNPTHLGLYKSRINDFLYSTYMSPTIQPGYVYVPGFLSGVWEGSFMTLPDHERAFGSFKFSGRIRADGCMIMCREPKTHADREGLGTWIFEGHLRYGVALVGQWRTSIPTAIYDLRGIFSLRKAGDAW
ncbi:hypothetical protein C0992_011822 [Termitomyces sp. T32_za158]|nr:hypothetical protein C0992_011822 [Termitomyces sp. T32_za158]